MKDGISETATSTTLSGGNADSEPEEELKPTDCSSTSQGAAAPLERLAADHLRWIGNH